MVRAELGTSTSPAFFMLQQRVHGVIDAFGNGSFSVVVAAVILGPVASNPPVHLRVGEEFEGRDDEVQGDEARLDWISNQVLNK